MLEWIQFYAPEALTYFQSEEGRKAFMDWTVPLLLGGLSTVLGMAYAVVVRKRRFLFENFKLHRSFYLYNPQTASAGSNHPRRSILKIRMSIRHDFQVKQINEKPKRLMYSGTGSISDSVISFDMASGQDGTKSIKIYHFKQLKTGDQVATGLMLGLNQDRDPFSVPILVSSRAWSPELVSLVLSELKLPYLNKGLASKLVGEFDARTESDSSSGPIEHPWGRAETITSASSSSRWYKRLAEGAYQKFRKKWSEVIATNRHR